MTRGTSLVVVGIVALTVSPIVVAAVSLVGDSWFPVGDLSHILYRVGQVGTRETPLVGAETIKGWAHPGPLEFWLAAPAYRLTGEDARSLFWTAAAVNVTAIAGIAAVTWRRGRFPLLVGSMVVVALLIHTLGPTTVVSIWNPFLPLFPFLLTIVLAWDVALGHGRSLVWMGVAATVAAQTHFAFLTLCGLVAAWLLAWCLGWRRLGVSSAGDDAGTLAGAGLRPPAPPWGPWLRHLRRAGLVVGVLWLPVTFDALFDLHNPLAIARSIATPPATVGPVDALGLVGRYVRPDGPWVGGAEPVEVFSVQGSGPLPLMFALAVLVGCLWVGRRRGLLDVVALSSLSLALVLGSVPAASQIFLPAYSYLTQFMKVVGALVWGTVAWTAWRLVAAGVADRPARRPLAAGVAGLALVGAVAWTWGDAAGITTPNPAEEEAVQAIRVQLRDVLPDDRTIRVEFLGDYLNIPGPGVISWLIQDGYDVLTSDGAHGLKWGHAHRWQRGEDYDLRLTVAIYYTGSFFDPVAQCADDPRAELVAAYDPLTDEERGWIDDVRLRQLGGESISADERTRLESLEEAGPMIHVFEGPRACARAPRQS